MNSARRWLTGVRRRAGFTLLELSLFIGLLGIAALYLADEYARRFGRGGYDHQMVNKGVRDMCNIIQASVQWHCDNSKWPNDRDPSTAAIKLSALHAPPTGSNTYYLSRSLTNPYESSRCANCDYEIAGADGDSDDDTDADDNDPTSAVNLRVRARVDTEYHAESIADMVPRGVKSGSASPWTVTAEVDGCSSGRPYCGIPGAAASPYPTP